MLEHINAGLIGYGYAGRTLHAPLLNATAGIHLHSIVSRDGDKVRAEWPQVQHRIDAEQLLADPDIDLVVIATPNDTHFPLAKAALLAGKHVVIDKPFTLDSREARQLIALAHEQDLQLSVFHNRRWDADFLTLRQLIGSGELGEVLYLESHFDRYRPQVRDRWREQAVPGSGLWYDLGAHLLDQTLQLFGEPESLWLDLAHQRPGAKTDDFFHAILQYGERRVVLHASTQVVAHAARFTVHGSLGSYSKQGLDSQEEQLKQGMSPLDPQFGLDARPGRLTTLQGDKERVQDLSNIPGRYLTFYQGMAEAIQRGTPAPVQAEEALKVMELIELGLRSAREGRRLTPGQLDSVIQSARTTPPPRQPISEMVRPRPLPIANRPTSTVSTNNASPATARPATVVSPQPAARVPTPVSSRLETPAIHPRTPPEASPVSERAMFRQPGPLDKSRDSVPQFATAGAAQSPQRPTPSPQQAIPAQPPVTGTSSRPGSPQPGGYRFGLTTGPGLAAGHSDEPAEPKLDLSHLDPIPEQNEPKLGTPVVTRAQPPGMPSTEPEILLPELTPASLLASERKAAPLPSRTPLPHLSVRDEDVEDDDLPPFSAS